jgi:hypothetical protein
VPADAQRKRLVALSDLVHGPMLPARVIDRTGPHRYRPATTGSRTRRRKERKR